MELLTAVNLILPKLGEHPVTSVFLPHPTLAIVLPEVENELRKALSKGWWFNTYSTTLYPNNEKQIVVGDDTLAFVPDVYPAALRNKSLFNTDTLSYTWDRPVKGLITQYVQFNELPETVAQYVWYSALVSAYITDLGMTSDVQAWATQSSTAYSAVLAEHLRNKKYATYKSPRFQRLRNTMRG